MTWRDEHDQGPVVIDDFGSTWHDAGHTDRSGPHPYPDWVVQQRAARDTELGALKTGKEDPPTIRPPQRHK